MHQLLQKPLQVNHENGYTAGHFDGHPIVPGAVSLKWMLDALAAALHIAHLDCFEIRNLKCLQELPPPCEVIISVFEKRPGNYFLKLEHQSELVVSAEVIIANSLVSR